VEAADGGGAVPVGASGCIRAGGHSMAAGFASLALQETVIAFGGEGQANGIFIVAVAVLGKGKAHKPQGTTLG
jgi:hypothetical protein